MRDKNEKTYSIKKWSKTKQIVKKKMMIKFDLKNKLKLNTKGWDWKK